MKKVVSVVLAVILVLVCFQFAAAQEKKAKKAPAGKPGAVAVDAVTIAATVEAVDVAKRTVTLKGPAGNVRTFKVGEEVRNLDQMKVGDQVKTTYVESVALFVRKSDQQPAASETQTVRVAPKGAKPGVAIVDTREITGKVETVDYKKRTVTLKGPEGNVATFPVDKEVKKFKNVKVGDEVVLRITEALAIWVETP